MFLSSMEWAVEQRRRAIEMAGRIQIMGKIPLDDFVLESINEEIDIAEELRCFRKYGRPLETSQLTTGPRVDVISITSIPTALGGRRFHNATFRDQRSPAGRRGSTEQSEPFVDAKREANGSTSTGGGSDAAIGQNVITEEKENVRKEEDPSATTLITERRSAIFDPVLSLPVTELDKSWNFFLAHQNICPLKFKRNVREM